MRRGSETRLSVWPALFRPSSLRPERLMEPEHGERGENPWAECEPYFDTVGLAKYLGATIDAVDKAIAAGAVLYLVTAEGESLMPASQFPDSEAGLAPRLGDLTVRMDPARTDPACVLIWALAPQKALGERTPIEVLRSSDGGAISQLTETAGRIGTFVG